MKTNKMVLLVLLLFVMTLFNTQSNTVVNAKENQNRTKIIEDSYSRTLINGIVTGATLTDSSNNPIQNVTQYSNIQVNISFSLPNNQVHSGDTSTISLPNEMKFLNNTDFVVKDTNGNIIANAKVDMNTKTITLTYTDFVETHSDVSGTLFVSTQIDTTVVTASRTIPIIMNNDGKPIDAGSLIYTKAGDDPNEKFWKYGWFTNDPGTERQYGLRVNGSGATYPDVVVSDKLQSAGVYYDENSFTISKGQWIIGSNGTFELNNAIDVTSQYSVDFGIDKKGFTVHLGDINGEGYIISYKTKNDYATANGEAFKNDAKMISNTNEVQSLNNQLIYQSAGGVGDGYNYSIYIEKKDEQGVFLVGAEFDVVRDATTQKVGKIIVGTNGKGNLNGLLKDNYTIIETKAPDGYQINNNPISVGVTDFGTSKSVTLTIINKLIVPEKIEINGQKKWLDDANQADKRPQSVTIYLLADNQEVASKEVYATNNWFFTFSDLLKYDTTDGHEIRYTIMEKPVSGYATLISGDIINGFSVTNTIIGKISIPIKKIWQGNANNKISIYLIANGQRVDECVLSEDTNWQYTFNNLEQYQNGKEIQYTIEEQTLIGFSSIITGNMKDGFIITNIENKPPVPPIPPNPPMTGYNSRIGSFIIMMSISLVFSFIYCIKGKTR